VDISTSGLAENYYVKTEPGLEAQEQADGKQDNASVDEQGLPLYMQHVLAIREMRKTSKREAAVDGKGAHCCVDQTVTDEKVIRFHILLAALLSSQTNDKVTHATMQRMHNTEYGKLTVENVLNIPQQKLADLLHPVGFRNNKSKYILKTAQIMKDEYGGDIPSTFDGLMALPGIGLKMATLVMQLAWNESVGICVDTHVHRISNTLRWVKTKNPLQTADKLKEVIPQPMWGEINHLLVGFGQTICAARPRCDECTIRRLCPTGRAFDKRGPRTPSPKKKRKVKQEEI
jgi:endonuclease-3